MEANTSENDNGARNMAKAPTRYLMETSTSVNTRMVSGMAKAHPPLSMEASTSVNGKAGGRGKAPNTTRMVMSPSLGQRVSINLPTNVRHLRQSQEVHYIGGVFAVAISVTHLPQ